MSQDADAVVVGGGISGLAAAIALKRAGLTTRLIESAASAGGRIRSERRGGYLLEWGPHSFPRSAKALLELATSVDLGPRIIPANEAARERYVLHGGRLHALPHGLLSLTATSLLSARAKLAIVRESFRRAAPREDESVASFFARRFDAEIVERVVAPFVSGVFAGVPEELEMRAALPDVHAWEREHGSVLAGARAHAGKSAEAATPATGERDLLSFPEGLAELPRALARALVDDLALETRAIAVERRGAAWRIETEGAHGREVLSAPRIVLAVEAPAGATLLGGCDPVAAGLLAAIPYVNVGVLQLGVRVAQIPRALDGFGFLVARGEPSPILGAIWASAVFPGRAPEGRALLAVYAGGRGAPEWERMTHDERMGTAIAGVSAAFGVSSLEPELAELAWIPAALPQYVVGHTARVAGLRGRAASSSGLAFAGNYLDGVSVDRSIQSGIRAAGEVMGKH